MTRPVRWAVAGVVGYLVYQWWQRRAPPVPLRATDQIAQLSAMAVPAGNQSGSIITGPADAQLSEQTAVVQEPWPGAGYSVPVYPAGSPGTVLDVRPIFRRTAAV